MGACVSCLTCSMTSLACCFTQNACRLCCSSLPRARASTATRVGYAVFMVIGVILSYLTLPNFVKGWIVKIPAFCPVEMDPEICLKMASGETIIRIWMAYAIFFAFMSLFTIDTRTSKDCRAYFHNGFWIFKIAFWIALLVGFAFVSISSKFSYASIIFGYIATCVFFIIQIILMIDFAYTWNRKWIDNSEDSGDRMWLGAILTFIILLYLVALALIIVVYVFFSNPDTGLCHVEKFIPSFNIILIVAFSIMSVIPVFQQHNDNLGLLPAAVVAAYGTFYMFTGMLSDPSPCYVHKFNNQALSQAFSIISTIITLIMIFYSSISNTDSDKAKLIGINIRETDNNNGLPMVSDLAHDNQIGRSAQTVYDDEEDGTVYSYSYFHFMLMTASLYMMLVVSDWYSPPHISSDISIDHNKLTSMWIKIVFSWICYIIYGWSVIAPFVLQDRDFF